MLVRTLRPSPGKRSKSLLWIGLLIFVVAVLSLEPSRFLSLEEFKLRQQAFSAARDAHPVQSALIFFVLYVVVTGLSIPGATVLTLAAGALFGLAFGTLLVSFASSIGASLSFLASRYLLRDWVVSHFGEKLAPIHRGVERDGAFYLFTLRPVPAFPFFLVNLVMGLTPLKLVTFYWVSQLGMLAATLVYVNAGRELAHLETIQGILSPRMLLALTLLGIFPLVVKTILTRIQARKVYSGWSSPHHYDRNLIVIGAGSAGLVTAYIAAAVRAKVTLVEKHRMGGDCLNTGCVPSKALIRSAKAAYEMRQAAQFGLNSPAPVVDFAQVMERVQRVIQTVEPHDSIERYTSLGVECLQGTARIISPWCVEVQGPDGLKTLTARNLVIATGARPTVPTIPGIDQIDYWTSDTIWNLRTLPERLLVLGAGPIGCEMAQAFQRLGSRVVQVDSQGQPLSREDPDISARLVRQFSGEGIDLKLEHKAVEFRIQDGQKQLICQHGARQVLIEFDQLLIALGRTANTEGFGLEEMGIPLSSGGTIAVNEYLQTRFPNILACGDVAGPYQFTHTAAHQAWFASVNSLFGSLRKFAVDYRVIPWTTFTDPEVARVGLNEREATRDGIAYEVTSYDLEDLDRAITDGRAEGVVKILTAPGTDKILGVTIVGEHAGELLAEYVLAMRHGLGLNKILSTIHTYPTLSEANKYAAGEWKKNHKPEALLGWVQRFHEWRRGSKT